MESPIYGPRDPGDCRKHARHAIIYDGTSTGVPAIENEVLVFNGGISNEPSQGVGFTGVAGEAFRLIYAHILPNPRWRGSVDPLTKKIRLSVAQKQCGESGEHLYLELIPVGTCEFPRTNWEWNEPIEVGFECNCLESPCQRLSKVAREINKRTDYPVIASVTNVGSNYYLDLTARYAGQDFLIASAQGFTAPKTLIPNFKQNFTARDVAFWFPNQSIALLNSNPTKKMTVVELSYERRVPEDPSVGVASSNELTTTSRWSISKETIFLVFDTATTQSNTALTALITVLTGTNAYNRKYVNNVSADRALYPYLVVRTDAGDAAALTDARTDYATGYVVMDRSHYTGGKSYYTLLTTSGTPPTADGSDVVTQGAFTNDDIPVIADGCPVVEDSICLDCI